MKSVDVVVPVFNNNESLYELFSEIQSYSSSDLKFQVIFVDDGSTDSSWTTILNIVNKAQKNEVIAVKLTKNFGQLAALKAGYSFAESDAVITLSADLQDPVNLVKQMAELWSTGSKLVLCIRKSRSDAWFIKLTSKIAYFLLSRNVRELPRGGFDTFLMDKVIVKHLNLLRGRFNFLQADVLSLGFKPKLIYYDRRERKYGKSGYNFGKRFKNFSDGILDSTEKLLKTIFQLGLVFTMFGLILAMVLIIARIQGKSPFSGFTLIACSIILMGGVQILMIGLIGSYIWKLYDNSRLHPSFVVDEIYLS